MQKTSNFPFFSSSSKFSLDKAFAFFPCWNRQKDCFFQLALCRPTKNFFCWKFPQVFFLILWKLAKASFRKKGDFAKLPPSNFGKIKKWCLEIFKFRKQGDIWSWNFWFQKLKQRQKWFLTNRQQHGIWLSSKVYFIKKFLSSAKYRVLTGHSCYLEIPDINFTEVVCSESSDITATLYLKKKKRSANMLGISW